MISARRAPNAILRSCLVVAMGAAVVGATMAAPAQAASSQTVSFSDLGVWIVPANVSSVQVELTGGDGGTAFGEGAFVVAATGGRGGEVTGTIDVSPGDELSFRVAEAGAGAPVNLGDIALGASGFGVGGDGYAPGGGSSAVELNGVLIAGAPGGGGGGAAWTIIQGTDVFAAFGGAGGQDGGSVSGLNGEVLGGEAGASPNNDGGDAGGSGVFSNNVLVETTSGGGGGAGWPGGQEGAFAQSSAPREIYMTGGGGGEPFVSAQLLNPTVAEKNVSGIAGGTASITFTPAATLAQTGANDATLLLGFSALLLLAGGVAWFVSRKRAATR